MTNSENVYRRINDVEGVVAANVQGIEANRNAIAELTALLNQNAQQQVTTRQRLDEFIETSNSNFERLVRDREEAQSEMAELQNLVGQIAASQLNLNNVVIPRLADKVAEVDEQVRTTSAGLQQLERTVDYLMRRDRDQNGGPQE
ncbi:MAG: hypothetical protein ACFB4I_01695 [Cyanophyceae cyanobacterium]